MERLLLLILFLSFFLVVYSPCLSEDEDLVLCIDDKLTNIPTTFKASITLMILSENAITAIDSNTLLLYPNLETLQLDNNQITTPTDFRSIYVLKNLRRFDISSNSLLVMDFAIFHLNLLLEFIAANDNYNLHIDENYVELSNLKEIQLKSCSLRSIPLKAFEGFAFLQVLDLRNNELDNVPQDILTVLGNLNKLLVSGNHILNLDPTIRVKTDLMNVESNTVPSLFTEDLATTPKALQTSEVGTVNTRVKKEYTTPQELSTTITPLKDTQNGSSNWQYWVLCLVLIAVLTVYYFLIRHFKRLENGNNSTNEHELETPLKMAEGLLTKV